MLLLHLIIIILQLTESAINEAIWLAGLVFHKYWVQTCRKIAPSNERDEIRASANINVVKFEA